MKGNSEMNTIQISYIEKVKIHTPRTQQTKQVAKHQTYTHEDYKLRNFRQYYNPTKGNQGLAASRQGMFRNRRSQHTRRNRNDNLWNNFKHDQQQQLEQINIQNYRTITQKMSPDTEIFMKGQIWKIIFRPSRQDPRHSMVQTDFEKPKIINLSTPKI